MQKVTMEDLGKIYTLSEVSYSPDGTAAAFVVSQAQVKENKYTSSIWVLENGVPRKLTSGGAESSYLWLDEESSPEIGRNPTSRNRVRPVQYTTGLTSMAVKRKNCLRSL